MGPGCQAEMINLYLFCDKFVKELNKDWFRNMFFLAATAALEVQMLVCVCLSVCLSHLLQLYWTPEGLLNDFQRTSKGLWTLWSTKFLQIAAPRSLRLLFHSL